MVLHMGGTLNPHIKGKLDHTTIALKTIWRFIGKERKIRGCTDVWTVSLLELFIAAKNVNYVKAEDLLLECHVFFRLKKIPKLYYQKCLLMHKNVLIIQS